LILAFSLRWPLFPPSDFVSPTEPLRSLHHLALPAVSLGLPVAGVIMRMTRSCVSEVLRADYVRTARAKGLAEWVIVHRHVLPNALINVLTIIGLQVGRLLGGSVVIETIFGWPGLGYMAYRAISLRDYPVAQGVVLFTALSYSVVTLLVDVLYTYIDPRLRYG
jgi:peptide/nickel transport system permease protein